MVDARTVSKHWNPDDELLRWTGAEDAARPRKTAWPKGATAGLMLVAASCVAVGALFYKIAGPREVVEESVVRR